jgi:hypothetical protein
MRAALALIAGPHEMVVVEGAGHDLGGARVAGMVVEGFQHGKLWS